MKALTTAIYAKGSTAAGLTSLIGTRFYKTMAPAGATFPYIVFSLVYDNEAGTFKEEIEDCLFQFSIFSANNSSAEAENIYNALKTTFDKCMLSVTGNSFLHMLRQTATLFQDEIPNPNGTGWVWHYAVDYNVMMQKN